LAARVERRTASPVLAVSPNSARGAARGPAGRVGASDPPRQLTPIAGRQGIEPSQALQPYQEHLSPSGLVSRPHAPGRRATVIGWASRFFAGRRQQCREREPCSQRGRANLLRVCHEGERARAGVRTARRSGIGTHPLLPPQQLRRKDSAATGAESRCSGISLAAEEAILPRFEVGVEGRKGQSNGAQRRSDPAGW
jgi:hypothetical protein